MQKQFGSRVGAAVALAAMLTAAGVADARPPHPAKTARPGVEAITLSGELQGTWRQSAASADAGGAYLLSGNGAVSPLGPVQASGNFGGAGTSGANGPSRGTFTLTGPKGTMTLALSGAVHPAAAASPSPVTFTVTGGTGIYAGLHGGGSAEMLMTPQRRPAAVPGRMTPHFIVAAMFTLIFGSPTNAAGAALAAKG